MVLNSLLYKKCHHRGCGSWLCAGMTRSVATGFMQIYKADTRPCRPVRTLRLIH